MPPSTPEASLPGITGLLDRVHAALRGIDAADTTAVIPAAELDAVSDAVADLESFCRRHGIALSEWAGRLPEPSVTNEIASLRAELEALQTEITEAAYRAWPDAEDCGYDAGHIIDQLAAERDAAIANPPVSS